MANKKKIVNDANEFGAPPEDMVFGLTLNEGQQVFRDAIMSEDKQVVMCDAVSGSGKTLVATACARMLQAYHGYDGVVYVFSANQEQALGYRPGTTEEKVEEYTVPLQDALIKLNEEPSKVIESAENIKFGSAWIAAKPSTFLRGVNFNHKVVIVDEVQNFTIPEIKKVISRCDDACKVILIGSTDQIDIKPEQSCFESLMEYLEPYSFVQRCKLDVSYRGRLCEAIDLYGKENLK